MKMAKLAYSHEVQYIQHEYGKSQRTAMRYNIYNMKMEKLKYSHEIQYMKMAKLKYSHEVQYIQHENGKISVQS